MALPENSETPMTRLDQPALSIVIACTDSPRAVLAALGALKGQGSGQVEILVVNEAGATVPRLRRIGLEAARGRVVAFLEDSCLVRPGWAEAWISAFGDDPSLIAASGVVEHDDPGASPLDRAVVFCEYAPFLPPGESGRPTRLAGNNFAVVRSVALELTTTEVQEWALLEQIRFHPGDLRKVDSANVPEFSGGAMSSPPHPNPPPQGGRESDASVRPSLSGPLPPFSGPLPPCGGGLGWGVRVAPPETAVKPSSAHQELKTVAEARVNHVRRFTWRAAFSDRFRFGLEFGRLRTVGASTVVRWLGLVAGPLIFGAQVVRLLATILRKPLYLASFLQALPITLALLASWTLGEWVGWSLGPPAPECSTARKPHETAAPPPGRAPGPGGSPRLGYNPGPPLV